ncbi:MAG TPA: DUF475 domain-containing protein [Rhodocyclaceae bacterium]|nr:DUF475 domain-containing protein [Rhodocyclaceae bacterium]
MANHFRYFRASIVLSLLAIAIGYAIGGLAAAATVGFLIVLETSLSFDNAVVNAGILRNWDEKWRRCFLLWGMLVAVFGMRLVFPVLIVALAAGVGPLAAVDLALNRPAEYGRILTGAHHQIAAFGGAFLMMVFLKFFVAHNKTHHWLEWIERPMTRLGKLEAVEAALTLVVILGAAGLLGEPERAEFITAGVWGVVTFIIAKGASALLGGDEGGDSVIRQGIGGFLYLELLDASFSFDGVVGAFAMTNNLIVIALGLGAGALFVRSFTIFLVEKGALDSYRYLEHGAFWAIGALAAIMLLGIKWHIPEAVTGLLGATLIVLSIASSVRANRKVATLS